MELSRTRVVALPNLSVQEGKMYEVMDHEVPMSSQGECGAGVDLGWCSLVEVILFEMARSESE